MRNYNNYDPIRQGLEAVQTGVEGKEKVKPENPFGTAKADAATVQEAQKYAQMPQDPSLAVNQPSGQKQVADLMEQSEMPMMDPEASAPREMSKEEARRGLVKDMLMQEEAAPFQTQMPGSYYSRY